MANGRAGPPGFTLVEILVALAVLVCLILPINRMFSGSVKVSKASSNLFAATNLASSYLEAVRSVPPETMKPVARVQAEQAGPPYDLKTLALAGTKGPLVRWLTVEPGDPEGLFESYRVTVEVTEAGKPDFDYRLATLVTWRRQP